LQLHGRPEARNGNIDTLEPPSADMETEAVSAGYYMSAGSNDRCRCIQILTIEELPRGTQVQMPPTARTFKQASKAESAKPDDQLALGV
jgi:hypothetical protein